MAACVHVSLLHVCSPCWPWVRRGSWTASSPGGDGAGEHGAEAEAPKALGWLPHRSFNGSHICAARHEGKPLFLEKSRKCVSSAW